MSNLIITGIPRAGTTLATAIVDGLEDTFALSEPVWQNEWVNKVSSKEQYLSLIEQDFSKIRQAILEGKGILDRRNSDGSPVTNYFARSGTQVGRNFNLVHINKKNLSPDFLLAIKHNDNYTCVLDDLVKAGKYKIFAIVRHPVPSILSWRSFKNHTDFLPIATGSLPNGEKFWPELTEVLEQTNDDDIYKRLALIYDVFCKKYLENQNELTLIKYESILENPKLFSEALKREQKHLPQISNQNQSANYPWEEKELLVKALEKHSTWAKEIYNISELDN